MNEELKNFKVMEWLKKTKAESYKSYCKDPKLQAS